MMEVILIAMCVIMLVVLLLGLSVVGIVLFALSRTMRGEHRNAGVIEPKTSTSEAETDDEEMRKIKEEKEQQEAQLRAFQQLLDYNPEIAYGLGKADADMKDQE